MIDDVTCLACGCLCDDIGVVVRDGAITEARRACPLGAKWFLRERLVPPEATIEGRPVSRDEALDRVVQVLSDSEAPLIVGLSDATVETVAQAVALADRLGALIDLEHADAALPALRAFQRVGKVTATLGEVRARADVVFFWECDPLTTHPRHWERYSVPDDRRVVLAADTRPTATTARAHEVLRFDESRRFETLATLRALVNGVRIDADEATIAWADRLKSARYGACFHATLSEAAEYEALFALVRDLNVGRRFVVVPLGGAGNPAGAEAVLAWQTGSATAVDFASGAPRSLPPETSARARIERGEADALLIVGAFSGQPPNVSTIVLSPEGSDTATVGLATSTPGIDEGGTVARRDGVWLPLRPSLPATRPSARKWLRMVSDRIGQRRDRA